MMQKEDFNKFAELLEYPTERYKECVAIYSRVFNFSDFAHDKSLSDLQELYIKTFEVEPLCNLYVGVHIFGEDGFKRGSFMSRLKEAYLRYKINENDVADFLPCILRLASKLEDKEKYFSLIEECILKPLDIIIDSFSEELNPYREIIVALKKISEDVLKKEDQIPQHA